MTQTTSFALTTTSRRPQRSAHREPARRACRNTTTAVGATGIGQAGRDAPRLGCSPTHVSTRTPLTPAERAATRRASRPASVYITAAIRYRWPAVVILAHEEHPALKLACQKRLDVRSRECSLRSSRNRPPDQHAHNCLRRAFSCCPTGATRGQSAAVEEARPSAQAGPALCATAGALRRSCSAP
jgi:hypothetical protein